MSAHDLTLDEIAQALQHVDPTDRETWLKMGMAVKKEFGECGFDVWDAWSQLADNYKAADARVTWKSFKRAGGIGLGTLVHIAQQGGYSLPKQELDPAERERRRQALEQRRRARQAEEAREAAEEREWQHRIAELAQELWDDVLARSGKAPYLGNKKVRNYGLKFARRGIVVVVDSAAKRTRIITGREAISAFFSSKEKGTEHISFRYLKPGTIAVPMRCTDGILWNLQFIFEGAGKKFLKHGRKSGTFHLIGEVEPGRPLALAEGYATAASVHEAMGWPVAVCWDAGNLPPVARALHAHYNPEVRLVVCGDDDHEATNAAGESINPGYTKAQEAARAVNGLMALPRFAQPAGLTDWNDLHKHEGLAVVREQLGALALDENAADAAPAAEPGPGGEPTSGAHQGNGGASTPPSGSAAGGDGGGGDDWRELLTYNKQGNLKADLHNLMMILEHDPTWAGMFRLDSFANEIHLSRATPYGAEPGVLTETDGTEIAAWLGHPWHYRLSVSSDVVLKAIEAVATRHQFHPVREYLDGLTWDGVERLPTLLSDFFGAPQNEYTEAVGRNWLVSAVARVRRPGCKVDFMVILEGKQGLRKSSSVRTLCGPLWFAEQHESPHNKDFFQVLRGRWIVEIPELQGFNKADRNKIKGVLSAQEDTYRPSYGRYPRQFPRQTIMVGTTNDNNYLKDETGARRFMPVRCSEINLEALATLRDQLWAEADARLARGETWWAFPESAQAEQDARFDADAWEEPIAEWLDGHRRSDEYPKGYHDVRPDQPVTMTTVSHVMECALGIEVAKHTKPDQMRVAAILKRLGWDKPEQPRKMFCGSLKNVFVRLDAP